MARESPGSCRDLGVRDSRAGVSPASSRPWRLLVVVARVAVVDVARQRGHGRVEVQRHVRDVAGRQQPVEVPDDLLGATDGEGRDEQDALVRRDLADDLGQQPDGLVGRLVLAAAVGRLHDHEVGPVVDAGRVADDGRAGPAQVAREDEAARRPLPSSTSSTMMAEPRMWPASRNVARMPGRDLDGLLVLDGPEERHGRRRRRPRRRAARGPPCRWPAAGPAGAPRGRRAVLRRSGDGAALAGGCTSRCLAACLRTAAGSLLASLGLLALDLGAVEEDEARPAPPWRA